MFLYLILVFGRLCLTFCDNYLSDIGYYFSIPVAWMMIFTPHAVMLIYGPQINAKFYVKKSFGRNAPLTENLFFEFTDTRYKVIGESFQLECAYYRIIAVVENKGLILFRREAGYANILPIRVLSADEQSELRTILASIPNLTITPIDE